MDGIMQSADRYIKNMSFMQVGLLKTCTTALGILIGLSVKRPYRKRVRTFASAVFTAAYTPLMMDFIKEIARRKGQCCHSGEARS